jgi:hypothetical protein
MIMCDGTWRGGGIYIQTDSFTIQDVVFLLNVLKVKFDLDCTINYQRGNPILYIRAHSVRSLIPHILPFMHPSMY